MSVGRVGVRETYHGYDYKVVIWAGVPDEDEAADASQGDKYCW